MEIFSIFFAVFIKLLMIVSEISHQNLSEYIQFLFQRISEFIKNGLFLVKSFTFAHAVTFA